MNPKIFAKLLVRDAFSLLFCSVWQFNLQWSFCLRALTSAHEQIKSELQKFTNSKTGEHPQWRFSLIFYWVDQIREIFWQLDSKRTFLLSLTPPAKIFFFFFSSPSQIRVAKVSDRLIGWAILTENLTDDRDSCAHNWLTFPNTLYLRKQKCPQKKKNKLITLHLMYTLMKFDVSSKQRGKSPPHFRSLQLPSQVKTKITELKSLSVEVVCNLANLFEEGRG